MSHADHGPGPGHSHGHGHGDHAAADAAVEVGRLPRTLLLVGLALAAIATVVGVIGLWPDRDSLDELRSTARFAAEGVTFPEAEVTEVLPVCAEPTSGRAPGDGCGSLRATVTQGDGAGERVEVGVPPAVSEVGLEPGDTVQLVRLPPAPGEQPDYAFFGIDRSVPLGAFALVFVLLALVVARWRGLFALVGLAISGLAIWQFMLPALIAGEDGALVALTTASAILFLVLYTTHGVSLRTSVALAGTLVGVAITGLIGLLAIDRAHLTGISDETGGFLATYAPDLDFQSLLTCGLIIAGLGVLNDVTITQASAVWELRAASPTRSRREIFASGMRIGRDHIASTIYTIVFVYAGTAVVVLLLLQAYDRPFLELISSEDFAEEIARTLTSAIGLLLAVPITTGLAALVAAPAAPAGSDGVAGSGPAADEDPDGELARFWRL